MAAAQGHSDGSGVSGGIMAMTPYEGLPVLFGFAGYWALTGLFVSQLIKYFTVYRFKDRLFVRIFVMIVIFTTLFFSSLVMFIVWRFFIIKRPSHVVSGPPPPIPIWSTLPSPTIAFVSTIVHFFFGWRMRMLRRSSKTVFCICAFVYSLSLTQFVSAAADFIRFNIAGRRLATKRSFNTLTTLWLIGGLACDLIITITMSALLFQVRERSTLKGTSKLLNKLIATTLETGLPTSMMSTAVLVTFIGYSQTNFDLCFMILLYIVYANAFMTALNTRRELRDLSTNNTMTSSDIHAVVGSLTSRDEFRSGEPADMADAETSQLHKPFSLEHIA
ncbi:hypothetical protein BDQ17DRAFT_1545276 [Cyathus striatus]|nr:hypothetical protein BDQ17DRAFT_1545276 [Cyathus striatus]